MAFFEEGASTSNVDLQVEATPTYIENYHEAVLAAVAEGESNYNSLMKAIGIHESSALRESGECVYTEGAIGSFWEKVKKMFMSLVAKLKGIFNSFMSRFDAQFKSGKSFLDKYKRDLAEKFGKVDKEKTKFVGYHFTHCDEKNSTVGADVVAAAGKMLGGASVGNPASLSASDAEKIVGAREKLEEGIEGYRGSLVGASSLTASEFNKELFQYFRDKESAKSEQSGVDFAYISGILGSDKASKAVSDSYKQLEKDVSELVKLCDKAQKGTIDTQAGNSASDGEKADAGKKTSAYPVMVTAFKGVLAAKQTFLGAQMTAIANRVSQAKQFAAQVVRVSVKESEGWQHYGEGAKGDDFLGSVTFR
jgi:hypothetical protein